MAQKRMFNLSVVDTDTFIEMPISSRLLYYELGMRADDDGFVSSWKKILMFSGLKEDDLKILIAKNFIIPFETGIIVIRHWRLNNYLQNDRIKSTIHIQEKNQLSVDENNVYNLDTECIHSIDKISIDKYSIDKNNKKKQKDVVVDFYNNNIGLITEYISENIEEYRKELTDELIIKVMQEAVSNNARTWKYVDVILKSCENKKIKTVEQFELAQVERNNYISKKANIDDIFKELEAENG